MDYAHNIALYLHNKGIGIYNQPNANIFTHPVIPPSTYVPAKAIFIFAPTGGRQPARTFDRTEVRYPVLNVRVRGDIEDYLGGESFAHSVYEALEGASIDEYIDVKCQQSSPIWIGYDSNNYPEWSINVEILAEKSY